MLSDIIKASFNNITDTPQYVLNMRSETMKFWLEFPQIIARQFGISPTDEDVPNMSIKEKHN